MVNTDELRFASLLCSRLCHDLIGSIGAINNGLELLGGDHDRETQREAMELIELAARDLRNKAQYMRIAFGLPGGVEIDLKRSRELALNLFAAGKIELDWPEHSWPPTLYQGEHKLLLNMLWLAGGALARGGQLRLAFTNDVNHLTMAVIAQGRVARLRNDLREALTGEVPIEELDAASVQAGLTKLLASHLGVDLTIDQLEGDEIAEFHLTAAIPR